MMGDRNIEHQVLGWKDWPSVGRNPHHPKPLSRRTEYPTQKQWGQEDLRTWPADSIGGGVPFQDGPTLLDRHIAHFKKSDQDQRVFLVLFPRPIDSLRRERQEYPTDLSSARAVSAATKLTGPIQLLKKILETWRLDKADAIPLLGLEPSDQGYAADVLAGRTALRGRDAKDRLAYLIQMRMALSAWFRDEQVENEWLREPQEPLDGEVPISLLLEGSMGNLLLVKEYIEAATGW